MITFSKDLLALNPAYNDSIIQFQSSSISNPTKAIIAFEGLQFIAVPINNKFTFNFKEILRSLINSNRFEDTIIPDLTTGEFILSDASLAKSIDVTITVFNLTVNESITKNYKFLRAAEQLINYNRLSTINPDVRVLLPTINYIDYNVRYFEGYPFDFAIYGIKTGDTYFLKNITTNQVSEVYESEDDYVKRIYLSDGANDTSTTDFFVNSSTLNKLELWVNNQFKANINLYKVESDCGIYLKWVNTKGSYSYWKFDSIYKRTLTPKVIDDFEGLYDNLQSLTSDMSLIGKSGTETINVDTRYNDEDSDYLKDLFISPSVQMYIHTSPFNQQQPYDFIGVKINDSAFTVTNTKTNRNKVSITITLPALNTIIN